MYEFVPPEVLKTSYGDPKVTVVSEIYGYETVVIEFQAVPASEMDEDALFARVRFPEVYEYGWMAFDYSRHMEHPDDVEFALIRVLDSFRVARMLGGFNRSGSPQDHRLNSDVMDDSLAHYRLAFDDFGIFDVIGSGVEISYFRAPRRASIT